MIPAAVEHAFPGPTLAGLLGQHCESNVVSCHSPSHMHWNNVAFAQQVPTSLQLVPVAGAPAQLPLGALGGSVQLEPALPPAPPVPPVKVVPPTPPVEPVPPLPAAPALPPEEVAPATPPLELPPVAVAPDEPDVPPLAGFSLVLEQAASPPTSTIERTEAARPDRASMMMARSDSVRVAPQAALMGTGRHGHHDPRRTRSKHRAASASTLFHLEDASW